MGLTALERSQPRALYWTPNLRVILRALDRWPEGYVEVESKRYDALGVETWHHTESFSLNLKAYEQHWRSEQTPLMILVHYLRSLVPATELKDTE